MRVISVIALLFCVGHSRRVQPDVEAQQRLFAEQLQGVVADPRFQEQAQRFQEQAQSVTKPMEAMMAEADQVEAVLADPKFQKEARRMVEPVMTLFEDPKVQEEAKRVVDQMKEVIADPVFEKEAKRIAEPLMTMLANQESEPERVKEKVKEMLEHPPFQKLTKPFKEVMADEDLQELQERVKLVTEEMKVVMADPSFQKQAERVSQPLKAMIADAKEMRDAIADPSFQEEAQRLGEQMQALVAEQQQLASPQKSLASLLLANPSLFRGGKMMQARTLQGRDSGVNMAGTKFNKYTRREVAAAPIKNDDIGVTRPIGYWDPLEIKAEGPERYRRFVEMEIKHGRLAMAACLGVWTTYAGFRWPGSISNFENYGKGLTFEDIPGGAISSWAAVPTLGWFQIVSLIAVLDVVVFKQDPNKEPGDVVPDWFLGGNWVRYPKGEARDFKLNAERNNGRAAMMGIIGMIIHEALTGNPVWPIGA